ncbi:hypothetical protein NCG89_11775 [Spongiibacter taiwanensis]|uniref:hypothetical protein n=1 Tax=Spongiibacter taiwanensis TaxID=1748242 RepID=UPI0020351664|nr:hypothetical protein [Spongiibacter taiwanensis]USA42200.1 hypothetical protein NCG89_11775 [Spongiibacter taiwanensis]
MRVLAIAFTLLSLSTPGLADINLGASVSTAGVGLELGYRHSALFNTRVGGLFGKVQFDTEGDNTNGVDGDELEYENDIKLKNAYLIGDWYPRGDRFRLSIGAFLNNSDARIVTRCRALSLISGFETCEFGDSVFLPLVLGEIRTTVDFQPVSPYLGVGWGTRPEKGINFTADLGVLYLGEADVTMRSTGICQSTDFCRAELKKEEREIQKELEEYRFLPILRLGVNYQF